MAKYVFDEVDLAFHRVVYGTAGNDTLNGYPAANPPLPVGTRPLDSHYPQDELFYGYAGNDLVNGRDGMDIIHGGNGNDIVNGGIDYDQLFGEGGNDILTDPDVATMSGGGGHDVLRMTVSDFVFDGVVAHSGYMTGGKGADQFRVTALGVTDIDDVNVGGPGGVVVIHDFHAGQGDKILLDAKLAGGGAALSGRQVFDLLDTNDDRKLSEADGSTAMGRVTWDGSSQDSDTGEVFIGSLHLRLGQTELEVAHTAQLTASDFLFG